MKAQVWSIDFVVSVIVFFIAVSLTVFAWDYSISQNQAQASFSNAESITLSVTDALIRTKGIPEDWDDSNVRSVGLASAENIVDQEKVEEFLDLDYNTSKERLGISRYEYHFELRYANNSVIQLPGGDNITKGIQPFNASLVIPAERYVLYNTKISRLQFILWQGR
ncbi:MAG: hypothetical protein HY367_03305 [Candidatus Aenigmarchaeota archaeon]|nr:hypothetical protein [Candidatus Aenigmarchaeota archaeon]